MKRDLISVKIRDIHKIKKKNSIGIPSSFAMIYTLKKCEDKHVDLLLIGEGEKKHYVLIEDFNTFMYDHTLHRERKHFCRYCLHAFVTEQGKFNQ